MKVKHIVIIFLLAYILEVLATYFKMIHLMGTAEVFTIAIALKILAAILGIWKLARVNSLNNLLDD